MGTILANAQLIVWILSGIGLLFLFNIPQNIYYHFRPDKKPDVVTEIELVDDLDDDEPKEG